MRDNTLNYEAQRQARLAVAEFESMYGMSSDEMLACSDGDSRLRAINPFEMMEWHYALEQVEAFSTHIPVIQAVTDRFGGFYFRYERHGSKELTNAPEPEMQLVA